MKGGSKVDHSLSGPGEPELWRLEIGDCERAARHLAGVFVTRSGRATGKTWIAEGGDSMDRERAEEFTFFVSQSTKSEQRSVARARDVSNLGIIAIE